MFNSTAASGNSFAAPRQRSFTRSIARRTAATAVAATGLFLLAVSLPAQAAFAAEPMVAAANLPDSPGSLSRPTEVSAPAVAFSSSAKDDVDRAPQDNVGTPPKMAGPYLKYIEPGQPVPRLTARDKMILGLKDAVSPFSLVAWVSSAGYEQALNNSPNYGQSGEGFAKRLGASAIRDFTEGTFGDSVLAPLLHEDPRFYRMGKGHNIFKRVVYAGTRGLITRTDSGHTTVNIANIGGNFGGALLTDAYYPAFNTTFNETMQTFGTSVGGSALGFAVTEFLPDIFHAVHLPAPGY